MTVLALNPSGNRLGWFMAPPVGPVRFGTAPLKDTTDPGFYMQSIDPFLGAILPKVDGLAIRKPFVSGESAWPAALKNVGMAGHIHYQASFFPHLGRPSVVDMPSARLTLAGHGHANDDRLIAAARQAGIAVDDEYQAVAYAIWCVVIFGAAERRKPVRSSKGRSIMEANSHD